eukprot:5810976-Pyramimonas_sp.AAC.1
MMKRMPPVNATVRCEILVAIKRPPITAKPVRHEAHGPIRRRKRRYILTTDQSDTGNAGLFSRRTNQTQEAQLNGPCSCLPSAPHTTIGEVPRSF